MTAKLLTSVLVLPHRPPVLTAKMLATIDVLSNGRLIVGCGVDWMINQSRHSVRTVRTRRSA